MKSTFIKNVKCIDKSRWSFPSLTKQTEFSPYFNKTSREIRVREIVDDLIRKHFYNSKQWLSEKLEETKLCKDNKILKIQFEEQSEENPTESRDLNSPIEKNGVTDFAIQAFKNRVMRNIEQIKAVKDTEAEIYTPESEIIAEMKALKRKYFRKWHEIKEKQVSERKASLKRKLFESNIVEPVDLEEELWEKWKQTKEEIEQMKSVLFLHWTSPTNIDYSFEYSRYMKEYLTNPLKWMDSKHSVSSVGLEMEGLRRWMKIEETYEKLKENLMKMITGSQDPRAIYPQALLKEKQKEYFLKIQEIKRTQSS